MAVSYLVTCLILAIALNAAHRAVRAVGTLLAGLALFMISVSIVLANFDGTLARYAPHCLFEKTKPAMLDLQAAIGLLAAAFLVWAAWMQLGRRTPASLALRNDATRFGLLSRWAHWTTAALMLLLVPMGLFLSILPSGGDRASFLAAHQALGSVVLSIVLLRIAWLLLSPPPPNEDLLPWERRLARMVHVGLYALIVAFPVSGILVSAARGEAIDLFGWSVPTFAAGRPATWKALHDLILPLTFYLVIALHIGAVVKHHVVDRRRDDIRRMLR